MMNSAANTTFRLVTGPAPPSDGSSEVSTSTSPTSRLGVEIDGRLRSHRGLIAVARRV